MLMRDKFTYAAAFFFFFRHTMPAPVIFAITPLRQIFSLAIFAAAFAEAS